MNGWASASVCPEIAALRPAAAMRQPVDLREPRGVGLARRQEVRPLPRIGRQVVERARELGGGEDELQVVEPHGVFRDHEPGAATRASRRLREVVAREIVGRQPEVREDRRREVERGREAGPSCRPDAPGGRRPLHQQRHAQRLLVRRRVQEVAVLAERLAVVAGHDDERLVPEPGAAQVVEEAAELPVEALDAAVVEPARDLALALDAAARRRS